MDCSRDVLLWLICALCSVDECILPVVRSCEQILLPSTLSSCFVSWVTAHTLIVIEGVTIVSYAGKGTLSEQVLSSSTVASIAFSADSRLAFTQECKVRWVVAAAWAHSEAVVDITDAGTTSLYLQPSVLDE